MDKIVIVEQQSIIDIAIQQYGSVDGVVNLMNDNPNLTFNSNLSPGLKLNVTEDAVDKDIVDYFRRKQLKVATRGTSVVGDFDGNDFDSNDFNT